MNKKTIPVESIIRKLYIEHEGKLIEVKQVEDVTAYPSTVTIYSKTLVKGASKGQTTYCVAIEDFIPAKRVSVKDSIQAMISKGLSAEDILKALQNK